MHCSPQVPMVGAMAWILPILHDRLIYKSEGRKREVMWKMPKKEAQAFRNTLTLVNTLRI